MTTTLVVPVPDLLSQPEMDGYAPLEGAVTMSFAAVRFPDGSTMRADDYVGAQALLSRRVSSSSPPETWDAGMKIWLPASGLDWSRVSGIPLVPPSADGPWTGVLVGTSLVEPATPNFPEYRLRGAFHAKRDAVEAFGLGPETGPIRFARVNDSARFTVGLTPGRATAQQARILLRNAAAQIRGELDIDARFGDTSITLRNYTSSGSSLAAVTLAADGSILLAPAAGRKVYVSGDLETEHIRYRPSGGGPKLDL